MHMANHLLQLVLRETEGDHAHFDQFINFGKEDDSFVVFENHASPFDSETFFISKRLEVWNI